MSRAGRAVRAAFLVAGGALTLAGCESAALSGAGQMRVDVEVYKGPLSKEPETQLSELSGVINETSVSMDRFRSFVDRYAGELGCWPVASGAVSGIASLTGQLDPEMVPVCLTLADLRADVEDLREIVCSPAWYQEAVFRPPSSASEITLSQKNAESLEAATGRTPHDVCLRLDAQKVHGKLVTALTDGSISAATGGNSATVRVTSVPDAAADAALAPVFKEIAQELTLVLAETSGVATQLKVKAANWAGIHLISATADDRTRRLATSFQIITAEYSNQLSSRADTLLKQLSLYGNDRQALPLSVHLRDVQPTEFVSLALWNYAVDRPVGEETAVSDYELNRLRVFNALYDDENWTTINTVQAVGQGDVSMAFIKDEIGNWNLKQFSSDPTELLDAYKNLGIATIGKATEIISGIATGGATEGLSAGKALSQAASNFALGGNPPGAPTVAGADLAQLRTEMVNELTQIRDTLAARETALATEVPAAVAARTKAATDLAAAQTGLQQMQSQLAVGGGSSAAAQQEADTQAALASALDTQINALDPAVAANQPVIANLTRDRDAATKASQDAAAKVPGLKTLEGQIAAAQVNVTTLAVASQDAKAQADKLKDEQASIVPSAVAQTKLVLRQYGKLVNALQASLLNAASGGGQAPKVGGGAPGAVLDGVPGAAPLVPPRLPAPAPSG